MLLISVGLGAYIEKVDAATTLPNDPWIINKCHTYVAWYLKEYVRDVENRE